MKKACFLVTDGIAGVAAEGEIVNVSDDGKRVRRRDSRRSLAIDFEVSQAHGESRFSLLRF